MTSSDVSCGIVVIDTQSGMVMIYFLESILYTVT